MKCLRFLLIGLAVGLGFDQVVRGWRQWHEIYSEVHHESSFLALLLVSMVLISFSHLKENLKERESKQEETAGVEKRRARLRRIPWP